MGFAVDRMMKNAAMARSDGIRRIFWGMSMFP